MVLLPFRKLNWFINLINRFVTDQGSITCSSDAYQILLKTWDKELTRFVEHFKILLLNRKFKFLGIYEVVGGCSGKVLIDSKLIFASAIKANANSIILAHNHPSGSGEPSETDKYFTMRMVAAGKLLEIKIYDHLIITEEGYFSFGDAGAL